MRDIAIIILKVEQSATLSIYLVQYPQSLALEPGGDKEGPKKTKLKWQEWEHRSLSVRKMMTS